MNARFLYLALLSTLIGAVIGMSFGCTNVLAAPAESKTESKKEDSKTVKTNPEPANTEKLATVLPPEQFFGAASMGYAAARVCPHICSKLFCYCGCDITDNHKCLLDCFTSMHGADCHICQEEALQALKMFKDDEPIAAIQKYIDENYSSRYPFKDESPVLKKYKSIRLWKADGAVQNNSAETAKGDSCCSGK